MGGVHFPPEDRKRGCLKMTHDNGNKVRRESGSYNHHLKIAKGLPGRSILQVEIIEGNFQLHKIYSLT